MGEGEAALARADWHAARTIFEAELEERESVDALEGLSWAAWWVEDVPACLDARERAYRLARRQGDVRRAAMLALWLGDDHLIMRGERAIANGWFQRAGRLLEDVDLCPEHGWFDALVGYLAMLEGDNRGALEHAARAQQLGRHLGVVALEMFGLSVEGVVRVGEGRVAEGMHCLDEATAAALAGEFEELVPAGWTCCLLLNACERARDYERAREWCAKVEAFAERRRINFVTGACRAHYGAVLTWHGRLSDADEVLTRALEDLTERPAWGGLAIVRLADLRRRQGRVTEAEELLERVPGNALTPVVRAEIALDRGDPAGAAELLEPVLRRIPLENVTLRATPVELMVRAQAARGGAAAAAVHLEELRSIADTVGTRPLRASATRAEGLVAAAAGDATAARAKLEDAIALFAEAGGAYDEACARAELARILSAAPPDGQLLTARQVEILRLVSEGLTDGEIAERLILSKHTVHRHMQNTYAKLGCSSRAAAVAAANRLELL